MSVWELTAYDTEMRQDRCREYTTSRVTAELWAQIPRIQFTDSGHGIEFCIRPHRGPRKPLVRRMEHADRELARLRTQARKTAPRKRGDEQAVLLLKALLGELFTDWRNVPSSRLTAVERQARELVLKRGF